MNAFAKAQYGSNGGNPAGVVLGADNLHEQEMMKIAAKVGYSETAFVMNSHKADYKVRFFTPVKEVDLCGHASIATFSLLKILGKISEGDYTEETKAGTLKIKVYDKEIFMEQNLPEFGEIIDKEIIKGCFTSDNEDFFLDLPIQVVSTGLRDILLPIKNLSLITGLKPNLSKIKEVSEKYDVTGIHAFTLSTLASSAHTRNFAPLYGIDEESATGTSNAALACYLNKYINNATTKYIMEQGYGMKKTSEIKVELKLDVNGKITGVYVGGTAQLLQLSSQ